jgi:prepilin-type N-terminal cleavage/methylation domain-containing protein
VTLGCDRCRRSDQRGSTLVEVLVALAVVSVGIVGVVVVVPVAIQGIHGGYQVSTATFLAEQALERARAAAWSERLAVDCLGLSVGDMPPAPTDGSCHGALSTQFPDESADVGGHPHYRRVVRVRACGDVLCGATPAAALRRVEVIVAYTPLTASGLSAREQAIRLEALVVQK